MALPKIQTPVYELTLPSNGEKIKFRPFLVKEEKILLMAQESGEENEMIEAVKQIVENCVFSPIKVGKLPLFDLEYIFLKLRVRSIGETSDLIYRMTECPENIDPVTNIQMPCKTEIPFTIDLSKIEITKNPNHNNKIEVNDSVMIVMGYPTIDMAKGKDNFNNVITQIDIIADCIEEIYEGENRFNPKDATREELIEFVESLPKSAMLKIAEFFQSMPKLVHEIELSCGKCGKKEKIVLEGIRSFFV